MDRILVVNGKSYKAKKVDFNLVCDFDDMGIEFDSIGNKKMSAVRAYVAICAGIDLESAGKEIEAHIVDGGNLEDVIMTFLKEVEESDFFRNLSKKAEKEVAETPTKKNSKK